MEKFYLIMGGLAALRELSSWIAKQIEIARQSGELTPEQEQKIRAEQEDTMANAPWWKKSTLP